MKRDWPMITLRICMGLTALAYVLWAFAQFMEAR